MPGVGKTNRKLEKHMTQITVLFTAVLCGEIQFNQSKLHILYIVPQLCKSKGAMPRL